MYYQCTIVDCKLLFDQMFYLEMFDLHIIYGLMGDVMN